MDVCVLRCTPGHIPRYMGRMNNNNNKRCQLWIRSMLCHVCLYQILLRISGFIIIILYLLMSYFSTCILSHLPPALILSYHEYSLLDINCCISTCSCILVLTTRFTMHVYDSDLLIYVCLLSTPFGIRITTRRGVLTPLDPHVQVLELGACGFSQLLIRVAQR